MTNSEIWETANSVLLKTRNKSTPSRRDPIFAIMASTMLLLNRSNLKRSITIVSTITVNTPMAKMIRPTLTKLQSTESIKLCIIYLCLVKRTISSRSVAVPQLFLLFNELNSFRQHFSQYCVVDVFKFFNVQAAFARLILSKL